MGTGPVGLAVALACEDADDAMPRACFETHVANIGEGAPPAAAVGGECARQRPHLNEDRCHRAGRLCGLPLFSPGAIRWGVAGEVRVVRPISDRKFAVQISRRVEVSALCSISAVEQPYEDPLTVGADIDLPFLAPREPAAANRVV